MAAVVKHVHVQWRPMCSIRHALGLRSLSTTHFGRSEDSTTHEERKPVVSVCVLNQPQSRQANHSRVVDIGCPRLHTHTHTGSVRYVPEDQDQSLEAKFGG